MRSAGRTAYPCFEARPRWFSPHWGITMAQSTGSSARQPRTTGGTRASRSQARGAGWSVRQANVKTVTIELESCYGIKKLQTKFDFSKATACAIYAPNGSMKSSLAQTFQDIADGANSKDRIFATRACKREIKDEAGADLPKESVLVVRPYDEVLGHSTKTSTLLVNPALRKEYEALHAEVDVAKVALLR